MQLFDEELDVVNVGLAEFGHNIARAGGAVSTLDWRPPAGGDAATGLALARLFGRADVDAANHTAFSRYRDAQPVLTDVRRADDAIPEMTARRLLLHSGPPIDWSEMCGPTRGAIIGAIRYEGWAENPEQAEELAARGGVEFAPCHDHRAVGPMAGIISPSMPVWVVENAAGGNIAYSNFNEGLGKVLRFGAGGTEVLDRLRWMGTELVETMRAAVHALGGLELQPLMAQALHMGDEVHNRNTAATGLLVKKLLPALLAAETPGPALRRSAEFIAGNDHFFLNLSMAACKAMLDAATGVPHSSMVTAMSRNGVNFGIRVSGTGNRWFQSRAHPVDGLFFPGYGTDDAAADLGDSTITETAGLGGFAMAASPALVKFVGGTPADATEHSKRMQAITLGTNPVFTLPPLNFGGTAAGIDARAVTDTGVLPVINSGIAHKQAGVGQIGAGVTTAPSDCFSQAVAALAAELDLGGPHE